MQKQMYKVHRPHFASGYLTAVHYEATTTEDGQPDWLMHYTPGHKARTEFAAFTRQSAHKAAVTLVATGRRGRRTISANLPLFPHAPGLLHATFGRLSGRARARCSSQVRTVDS